MSTNTNIFIFIIFKIYKNEKLNLFIILWFSFY